MERQEIGLSGIEASRVALGVMRFAKKTQEEATEAVRCALNSGIDFFDTADIYGRGLSSQMLGQAFRDLGVDRDDVVIQTKAGIRPGECYDFSRAHLERALDEELERLGTDHVDFFLLHRPDPLVDVVELANTLEGFIEDGKVLHLGVSNMNPWQVDLLQSALDEDFEVNQLQFGLGHTQMVSLGLHANMVHAVCAPGSGMIEHARVSGITIQAWSPLQYGTFAGTFIGNPDFAELNAALEEVAAAYDATPTAIACAWILRHPARMQVICGATSPDHIAQAASAMKVRLTREEWWKLYRAAGNDLP